MKSLILNQIIDKENDRLTLSVPIESYKYIGGCLRHEIMDNTGNTSLTPYEIHDCKDAADLFFIIYFCCSIDPKVILRKSFFKGLGISEKRIKKLRGYLESLNLIYITSKKVHNEKEGNTLQYYEIPYYNPIFHKIDNMVGSGDSVDVNTMHLSSSLIGFLNDPEQYRQDCLNLTDFD